MDPGLAALKIAVTEEAAIRGCLRRCAPLSLHDDVVQVTLIQAWKGGRKGTFPFHEGQGGQRGWLVTVALRLARRATSAGIHEILADDELELEDPSPSVLCTLEQRELATAALAELRRDEPLFAAVADGFFLEGCTAVELGRTMGVCENTMWTRLHLMRDRLTKIGSRLRAREAYETRSRR